MVEFFSSQSEVKHLSNFSRKVSLTIFLSEVNNKQKFYFERTCLGQFGFILRCVMGMHLPWWVFWGCLLCRLCPEDQHTELYQVVPVSAQPGRWYLSKNEQKIRILLNRCQFLLKCFSIGVRKTKTAVTTTINKNQEPRERKQQELEANSHDRRKERQNASD